MQQIASNYLARLAEYRQLITETREAEELYVHTQKSTKKKSPKSVTVKYPKSYLQSAKQPRPELYATKHHIFCYPTNSPFFLPSYFQSIQETEHLLRGADRSEGEVAKIMTQIRTMTKTLHKEHTQAKVRSFTSPQPFLPSPSLSLYFPSKQKENFDALQSLASERQRFEESAAQLKEAESALECKAERMQQLNDKIGQLRAERDMYIEDKKSIFARWRKMEERHTTNENKRHTALLAFSPPDSPCHPLRLHTLSDAEANRVLRSYTVSPQSTLLASISPATKQTPG